MDWKSVRFQLLYSSFIKNATKFFSFTESCGIITATKRNALGKEATRHEQEAAELGIPECFPLIMDAKDSWRKDREKACGRSPSLWQGRFLRADCPRYGGDDSTSEARADPSTGLRPVPLPLAGEVLGRPVPLPLAGAVLGRPVPLPLAGEVLGRHNDRPYGVPVNSYFLLITYYLLLLTFFGGCSICTSLWPTSFARES